MPKVCDIINDKFLPEGEPKISLRAFYRFFKNSKYAVVPVKDLPEEDDKVDTYDEMIKLAENIDCQIEEAQRRLARLETDAKGNYKAALNEDDAVSTGDYKELAALLEKLVSRKQSILNDITKYQATIATYSRYREIIRILVNELKAVPYAYEAFRAKLETNKDLKNLCGI